jgi:hypothetical protein
MPPRKALPIGLVLALLLIAPVLWLTLVSWTASPIDTMDDPKCEAILNDPESVDAIEWLKTPTAQPRIVGSMAVDDALALAYKLQQSGASRITADRKAHDPATAPTREESRGIVIQIPEGPQQRLELFRLYAKLLRNAGVTPNADNGQKYLFVPWNRDETGSLD